MIKDKSPLSAAKDAAMKKIDLSEKAKNLLILNGYDRRFSQEGEIAEVWLHFLAAYPSIYCSDGGFQRIKQYAPLLKIEKVIGDFDSQEPAPGLPKLFLPDQSHTDFYKSLQYLIQKGVQTLDVLCASGGQMDHFLGILSVAQTFKYQIQVRFLDEYGTYFYAPKQVTISSLRSREIISLIPLCQAKGVTACGVKYPVQKMNMRFGKQVSLRNEVLNDTVEIQYQAGNLWVFIISQK